MKRNTTKNQEVSFQPLDAELKKGNDSSRAKNEENCSIFKVKPDADGIPEPIAKTQLEYAEQLQRATGSYDKECAYALLKQAVNLYPTLTKDNMAAVINEATPLLTGIGPKDELEGMLAVQMVGIHVLAMEMMKRSTYADQTIDGVDRNVNRAIKLSRTFVAQIEALNRHRNKEQKMVIQHVHVNEGSQAIIGNIGREGLSND